MQGIMIDETTDVAVMKQLVIYARYNDRRDNRCGCDEAASHICKVYISKMVQCKHHFSA